MFHFSVSPWFPSYLALFIYIYPGLYDTYNSASIGSDTLLYLILASLQRIFHLGYLKCVFSQRLSLSTTAALTQFVMTLSAAALYILPSPFSNFDVDTYDVVFDNSTSYCVTNDKRDLFLSISFLLILILFPSMALVVPLVLLVLALFSGISAMIITSFIRLEFFMWRIYHPALFASVAHKPFLVMFSPILTPMVPSLPPMVLTLFLFSTITNSNVLLFTPLAPVSPFSLVALV